MLRHRFLLGTLFIAALAGLCWLDGLQVAGALPGAWLFPLAVALSLLCSGEMIWLLTAAEHRPQRGLVYAGSLAIVASNGIPLFWPEERLGCPLELFGWPLERLRFGRVGRFHYCDSSLPAGPRTQLSAFNPWPGVCRFAPQLHGAVAIVRFKRSRNFGAGVAGGGGENVRHRRIHRGTFDRSAQNDSAAQPGQDMGRCCWRSAVRRDWILGRV